MNNPDFFLSSTESKALSTVFECKIIKKVRIDKRNDALIIMVDPPIDLTQMKVGDTKINYILIASRVKEQTVINPRRWPVLIHVARILIPDFLMRDEINVSELDNIAWGEIYKTKESAESK